MIVIPAIDIKDGKVVRLLQGHFDKVTEYAKDPLALAKHWQKLGAQWLHVVDLDGAQTGEMKNLEIIKKIAKTVSIPIEVGGGIRGEKEVKELLKAKIARVILGTRVVREKDFLKKILSLGQDKIAVSLDCSNGFVTQRGWVEVSDIKGTDFAKDLEAMGLKTLIYTDVAKDGTLSGPNWDGLKEILKTVEISVIASGGISSLDDIKKLMDLKAQNLWGAITGKAIYENKLDFRKAVELTAK
ncbi:MAG: 1-(5-phosphoribosyl)-5-[(5-phosphoribosylamino)methylideneamino]imidazole-4-carboxamide isomerase [Omnitrophica WOR_2 bacterium GWA2_47_8]|nr:MAG: 1-(5-phosphoribosyl)-5-[(5-phosphoribosylamino)methylideneamino]imidazole-4-carboxamide isomerase [Omnitrophica WOR_2 bacterium GWA2_47_8]